MVWRTLASGACLIRVLFLHSGTEDYQAAALFHGLRSVLGIGCVDAPRYNAAYADYPPDRRAALRGRGFTLYGLLPEVPELAAARGRWADDLSCYDLVVVPRIWRQWQQLAHPAIRTAWRKVVLIDGEDGPAFFPYALHLLRTPRAFSAMATTRPYFKREWCGTGADYGRFAGWLPEAIRRRLPPPRRALPLSFAIPECHLTNFDRLAKTKDFPRHLVDAELAATVGAFFSAIGTDRYTFDTEADYFADLQASRFGVTTKRAGWDCLRHYELAASGCVLCFRDLHRKPPMCAPHGLTPANSISYRSPGELADRLKGLSIGEYDDLLTGTREWIMANTTVALAERFLTAAADATGGRR